MKAGEGYGSAAAVAELEKLKALGVDSIAVVPFGFQRRNEDTAITWTGRGGDWILENDPSIVTTVAQAHRLHFSVLLKPHLWLHQPAWPGSIDHDSDEEWEQWFRSYSEFILHYATMAEQSHVEAFSVGNELVIASGREQQWRSLIAAVRRVYHGQITYCANFDELFHVRFFDAVDFIGVSAYWPLSRNSGDVDAEALANSWAPVVQQLARLSRRAKKPIVFTELGYRSDDAAVTLPWEHRLGGKNTRLQASAYEAFFRAVWSQPWCGGVFCWKWDTSFDPPSPRQNGYVIEGKPAAEVVRTYFLKGD